MPGAIGFFGRAVPWTRLMLEKVIFQNDLNTRINNIISIPVGFVILAAPLAAISASVALLVALSVMIFVLLNRGFLVFLLRKNGLRFALSDAVMTLVRLHLERRRCFGSLAGYLLDRAKIHEPSARRSSASVARTGDLPLKTRTSY